EPNGLLAKIARARLADAVYQQDGARLAASCFVDDDLPAEDRLLDAVGLHPGRRGSSGAALAGPSAHAIAAAARQPAQEDIARLAHQTFISRTYRPPAKRSTVNTRPRSST